MSYDNILYDTDGRVATVTLNRPEKLNALSNELRGEMFHALKEAEADSSVGVVIIKGAGRAFSAGYDLQPSPDPNHPHTNDWTGLPDTGTTHPQHYDWSRHAVMGNFIIWELAKPVIGQIHGYCLAGATELASACDLRIIADDCQVGYPLSAPWARWTPCGRPGTCPRPRLASSPTSATRTQAPTCTAGAGPTTRSRLTTSTNSRWSSLSAWATSTTIC